MSSNPGAAGTYVKPMVSSVLTLPPPPVPSTSRTSGMRRSCAARSAHTIFCQMAASAAPPRTVKSSAWSAARRPAIRPVPDDAVGGQEVLELAVVAVRAHAGERARLVEGALVEQAFEALAHRQAPGRVLARHALLAAHPLGQLLAASQLLQLWLPAHAPQATVTPCGGTGRAISTAPRSSRFARARARTSSPPCAAPPQAERTVRAVGAGHSFTDIALTNGHQVSLDAMDAVLDADRESGLVRVEAGITIHELSRRLWDLGLSLENLGDIDVQSIAGAISTATHGTGAKLRNIGANVVAVELVAGDGSVVELDESDLDGLRAARASLGALGIITAVTVRAVPAFVLEGVDRPEPLDDVLASLDERVDGNDHFEFFFFPHADVALTRTNNRVDRAPVPRGRAKAWFEDVLVNNHVFHAFCLAGRAVPSQIPRINRTITRRGGHDEAGGPLLRDLRQPAPRPLHRDGVRRFRASAWSRRSPACASCSPAGSSTCPSRSSAASSRPTTPTSRRLAGARRPTSRCTCSRAWRGSRTSGPWRR